MVTYIPYFISVVVVVGIMMQILSPRIGAYGVIYNYFTGEYPSDILGSADAFKHLFVWSGVWQHMGWNSIIYLAALSGVDPQLHEAAVVDGASRWKRIFAIDIPTITPTIIILLIMETGRVMTLSFEKIFLLQNSLNISQSEVISTYVYNVSMGSSGNDFSYGTAIGLFNSVINLILIISVNRFAKKFSENSLW